MEKQTVRLIICAIAIMSGFGAIPALAWLAYGALTDPKPVTKAGGQ